ncbi:hypothetical protein [Streptomyces sp. NPDC051561]|uniref:hypothetical protein n=1 Tax=Streptomyces sp. NPDC051561 TaxID=3365658 RepID=UPI00379CEF80
MTSREQLAVVVSHAVFATGLAVLLCGAIFWDRPWLADIGAGTMLAALPLVTLTWVRRQQHIDADKAEMLRREGYRLGLEHAHRGLLNPPPVIDDGPGAHTAEVATVHRLHAVPCAHQAADKRRAQHR